MKTRKVPVRMCVACRQPNNKKDMLRVVKMPEGIKLDMTGKAQGRGAYICPSLECMEKAKKSRALERALESTTSDELFSEIRRAILRRDIV